MKKKILGMAFLASTAMLTSCMDPEQNSNEAVLQNALTTDNGGAIYLEYLGINQSSVPEFENGSGANPTQVTVTFSGGATAAIAVGCELYALNSSSPISPNLSATGVAEDLTGQGVKFDTLFGILACGTVTGGQTFSADIQISFTAGGKNYTANTTLTAVGAA